MELDRRGTTLAELVVVIAIVALAATLTLPNIGAPLARYRLKTAAREISNFLQETRAESIKNADTTSPVVYRVAFDSALGTYKRQKYQSGAWADDGAARTLPANITMVNLIPDDLNTYYFRTDGSMVLDYIDPDTEVSDPTDDQSYEDPETLRIQLRNARNDRYEVNLFSSTGLTEIKEGWSS
jgi:type II secretory pathway pseudopilin PulG